ncbi:hypothetical protein RKD31_000847 [Streptomyces sp. SAI-163]
MICLAQLMDGLDVTIVNVALPHAQAGLGFSDGDRQWTPGWPRKWAPTDG